MAVKPSLSGDVFSAPLEAMEVTAAVSGTANDVVLSICVAADVAVATVVFVAGLISNKLLTSFGKSQPCLGFISMAYVSSRKILLLAPPDPEPVLVPVPLALPSSPTAAFTLVQQKQQQLCCVAVFVSVAVDDFVLLSCRKKNEINRKDNKGSVRYPTSNKN